MNLTQILLSLRARRSLILWSILLCLTTALTVSLVHEKSYRADATLVLTLAASVPTELEIISSKTVALSVVDDLKLADLPSLQQEFQTASGGGSLRVWLADRLLANLQGYSLRDSHVVHIIYSSSSADEAAATANAFARGYLQLRDRLHPASATDAVELAPASPPADATGMPLWAVSLLSILSGAVFGAMLALAFEHRDRRVRSEFDLLVAAPAPFLGAPGPLHAQQAASGLSAESRLRFWRKWPWKT